MSFVDGVIVPVKAGVDREGYRHYAEVMGPIFLEFGATRVIDAWGEDVPHGKRTDLYRAVAAEEGETVVFSWIEWPDKGVRDAGWNKAMVDSRMQPGSMAAPFDMGRMIFGGFSVLFDTQERTA